MNTMRLGARPAATVNLIGGRLCLDFVNTMGARRTGPSGEMVIRDEKLNDYIDLTAWVHHAGAFQEPEVRALLKQASRRPSEAADVLREALRLREALYRILQSILLGRGAAQSDLVVLNEELQTARSARQLAATSRGFEWRWGKPGVAFDKILWLVAESAADLLTTGDLSRLRQCGGDDCGWLFEDITRNRSRHWCDTRDCGNRDRVRRFRLQQRSRKATQKRLQVDG